MPDGNKNSYLLKQTCNFSRRFVSVDITFYYHQVEVLKYEYIYIYIYIYIYKWDVQKKLLSIEFVGIIFQFLLVFLQIVYIIHYIGFLTITKHITLWDFHAILNDFAYCFFKLADISQMIANLKKKDHV